MSTKQTHGEEAAALLRELDGLIDGDRYFMSGRRGHSEAERLGGLAGRLGLDPARIGIKGESGGGGFAAAAALYARDRRGPKFAFQHLIYPMIDDRTAVRKDLHPYVGEFVWTQENNYFGWRSLLGEEPGAAGVSPYAAAARAADVSGLPPTYISVGGLDLFLEENLTYADRLSRAGVHVELHMYPRAYHGFYRVPNARVTKQAEHDNSEALRRFLHG